MSSLEHVTCLWEALAGVGVDGVGGNFPFFTRPILNSESPIQCH